MTDLRARPVVRAVARPAGRGWLALAALVALEALSLATYLAVTPGTATAPRYLLYPFVWIDASLWAVWRTEPSAGSRAHRWLAGAVGAGYFLLVMWVPGNIGLGAGEPTLRVAMQPPGWGPLVAVGGPIRLYLVPFEVVGYLGLAYLVYAVALEVTRGLLSGVLGLVTCVGCTVPVLAPLVGLLGGPAAGLASTAYAYSYDVGTVVFLATLGLLYASHRGRLP